jgi:hypothetical protein
VPFASCVPIVLALAALWQGGYTTEKHPDLGLTFPRARDYEQVPVPPDEPFVVLYFAERIPEKPRKNEIPGRERSMRPELNVVWIDEVADPAPPGADETAPSDSGGPKHDAGGRPVEPPKPPVNSLERWVEQRMPGWKLGESKAGRTRKGWGAREYELKRRSIEGFPAAPSTGWIYAWRGSGRTIAFVGTADVADFERHVAFWRESAEKVELDEPEEISTAKLERRYAVTKLRGIPFRIEVRKKLVRGWKVEDTENFIVVSHTPDQPLVRKIVADVEVLRKEYEKLFPPDRPVTAVATVRVCKDREEYLAYGGSPTSSGFWNAATLELVFYDDEIVLASGQKSDEETLMALYHEAFHQYIHDSTGGLPPHSWFDEGHGDYFAGARVRDGKVRGILPHTARAADARQLVEAGKSLPWKEILYFEQSRFYADAARCYAQSWALIYFLRASPLVEKRPEWARILPTYFGTLKSAWAVELAKLAEGGKQDDPLERYKGGLTARIQACRAAFEGVDLDALDAAWREFVLDLDVPRSK